MALYSINSLFPPCESWLHRTSILPHNQCFWYGNKMNDFPLYPLLENVINDTILAMLGIKIKLCSSKYFIQFNAEATNNLHPLFLQESRAKDGLLLFKYYKLSYRNTESNIWLATYTSSCARSCFSASAPCGLCLIRYSILIGCFNRTFCLVKYTVLQRKLWRVG